MICWPLYRHNLRLPYRTTHTIALLVFPVKLHCIRMHTTNTATSLPTSTTMVMMHTGPVHCTRRAIILPLDSPLRQARWERVRLHERPGQVIRRADLLPIAKPRRRLSVPCSVKVYLFTSITLSYIFFLLCWFVLFISISSGNLTPICCLAAAQVVCPAQACSPKSNALKRQTQSWY